MLNTIVKDVAARRERIEDVSWTEAMDPSARDTAIKTAEQEYHSAQAEAARALFRYLSENPKAKLVERAFGALCHSFFSSSEYWAGQLSIARTQVQDAAQKVRAALEAKERPDTDVVKMMQRATASVDRLTPISESSQEVYLNVARLYEAVVGKKFAEPKPKTAAPWSDVADLTAQLEKAESVVKQALKDDPSLKHAQEVPADSKS